MCLFVSNRPVVIIAEESVVCYKIVRVNRENIVTSKDWVGVERKFETPYQGMQVKIGRSYYIDMQSCKPYEIFKVKKEVFEKLGVGLPVVHKNTFFRRLYAKIWNSYHTLIEEGAFHSYATLKGAKKGLEEFGYAENKMAIIKCTIPKGSKYIVGKYTGKKCYASDCIYYAEEVKLS